ncbi:hypothetical protein L204_100126 [Cryptococcus depauperatus]|nr:transmembrane protein [Cryptococcus depauperatus CBS 7855]
MDQTISHSSSLPPSYTPSTGSIESYPQSPISHQRKSSTTIVLDQLVGNSMNETNIISTVAVSSEESEGRSAKSQKEDCGQCDSIRPIPPHMCSYTLSRTLSDVSSLAEEGEATPLLSSGEDDGNHGKWYKGPLFKATVKLVILFTIFTAIVVGTFYWGMPKLDAEDRGAIKLPKSFADLQALNALFQKYKNRYPFRILACGVVSYLFVQTFSLPGSMYISILLGAAYGIIYGLFLSCLCESIGSLLCYTLSSLLAPPLLSLPFYRARVETWRTKIMGDPKQGKGATWDSVFATLLVLRIAPFPPHWIANFVAPHLGIGRFLFWSSCFIGIAPVSVIHVTIGSSLDDMTSASDFHPLSLRNILGLSAVIVAVLIPVGLKRVFKRDLGDLGSAEEALRVRGSAEREISVPGVGAGRGKMYHAIDSGVVLAVPSRGDGMDMRNKLVKGKGRVLQIIPDHDEEFGLENGTYTLSPLGTSLETSSELDDDEPGPSRRVSTHSTPNSSDYHLYDPQGHFDRIQVRPYRPDMLKGYGAIERPPPTEGMQDRERATEQGWFGWARSGLA